MKALKYYKLYASVKEKMLSEKYRSSMIHIQTEYDLYKKEKEIELYKLRTEQLIKTNKDLDEAYKTIKIQNKRLKELSKRLEVLSNVDELTNLYNRRWLNKKIHQLKQYKSKDRSYSLVLCDIDNFKYINDMYGHHFGDSVLIEISRILKQNLSSSDYAVRWGGEEILILMDEKISESALIMNKVRKVIENNNLEHINEMVKITMTFGISEYINYNFDKCLIEADKAMYYGKENGKNCVVLKSICAKDQEYIVIKD